MEPSISNDERSNQLVQIIATGQTSSDTKVKQVLTNFLRDLLNVEQKQKIDQQIKSSLENNGGECVYNKSTLLDLNLNQPKVQTVIHWKLLEYAISELDYLDIILDECKDNMSQTGGGDKEHNTKVLNNTNDRLEEIETVIKFLSSKSSIKSTSIEYNELLSSVESHIKRTKIRVKSQLNQVRNDDEYSNVLKYGWIEKRCGNKQTFRTWKKMYFLLKQGGELQYYIKDKNHRKSVIQLNGAASPSMQKQKYQNLEGELGKKKEGKGWKVRWMRLTDHSLMYFQSHKERNPLGIINLAECKECSIYKEDSNKFVVVLNTESFYFKTSSRQELNRWVEAVKTRLSGADDQTSHKMDLSLFALKGIIDLSSVTQVSDCQKFATTQPNCIVIQNEKKNYYLSFDDSKNKQEWLTLLTEQFKIHNQNKEACRRGSFIGNHQASASYSSFSSSPLSKVPSAGSVIAAITGGRVILSSDRTTSTATTPSTPSISSQHLASVSAPSTPQSNPTSPSSSAIRKWEFGSIKPSGSPSNSSQNVAYYNNTSTSSLEDGTEFASQIFKKNPNSFLTRSPPPQKKQQLAEEEEEEEVQLSTPQPIDNNCNNNNDKPTSTTITTSTTSPSSTTKPPKLNLLTPTLSDSQSSCSNGRITSDESSNSSSGEEDSSGDEILMPMSLRSEIMRRSAINMTKTFKLEVSLPIDAHDNETYTFLFSDSVLVDQVKSFIFRRVPALHSLPILEYRLGLDEDNILEIEFLKFIYSNTLIELALKTCGIVRCGIYHHRKDRRTKEKLYPEKFKSISTNINQVNQVHNPNNNNDNSHTIITQRTTLPSLLPSSIINNDNNQVESSPTNQQPPNSDNNPNNNNNNNNIGFITKSTSFDDSADESQNDEKKKDTHHGKDQVGVVVVDTSSSLITKSNQNNYKLFENIVGWNVENVNEEFTMSEGYQPKLTKQDNTFYRKCFTDNCQSVYSFLGIDPKNGPMAFSLVRDFKDNYRGILHTKSGAKTSYADHKSINFGNLANLSKRLKRKKIISHLVHLINNNDANGFNVETKHLSLASNQTELQKELLSLEERQTTSGFKFGIVVCKPGQTSDNELFGNESGGEEYEEFLDLLGDRIELMGWQHYSAGLDVRNNSTGTHSLYTEYQGNEVMFHVSTMLPFDTRPDSQQIERKRQIGNDICVVIFNEGKDAYNPNTITSQFNHIVIVVTVIDKDHYQVSLSGKDGVVLPIDPPTPLRVNKKNIRDWLLTKLINAEMHSLQAPSFAQKISRTRETLLKYFIEQYL